MQGSQYYLSKFHLKSPISPNIVQFWPLLPLVVLVWSGSCSPECSVVYKQINLQLCLFLTEVCEVPEHSDTSTANDTCGIYDLLTSFKDVKEKLPFLIPFLKNVLICT